MSTSNPGAGASALEYSGDQENQLEPEDTLIDRGVDDVLDEGYSPAEQPHGHHAFGPSTTLDQILSEEEADPAARVNVLSDDAEMVARDAGICGGAASAEEAAVHITEDDE